MLVYMVTYRSQDKKLDDNKNENVPYCRNVNTITIN